MPEFYENNYNWALQALEKRTNFEKLIDFRPGEDFDLQALRALLEKMNLVKALARLPSVHITGSTGKGSTALFLEALVGKNHSVGVYLSPHLEKPTERIRLGGAPVSEKKFAALALRVLSHSSQGESYFEILTAMAFEAFLEESVDLAIYEVGLGGKMDATNLNPSHIAIFTPIEVEHSAHLGSTRQEIARQKAGIVKETTLVALTADQTPEVEDILQTRCQSFGIPLWKVKRDLLWHRDSEKEIKISLLPLEREIFLTSEPAFPPHRENLLLAAGAALAVEKFFSLNLKKESLAPPLQLPGRIEMAEGNPVIAFDTAHTPCSLAAVLDHLKEHFGSPKIYAIAGFLKGKEVGKMVALLDQYTHWQGWITLDSPRALPAREVAQKAEEMGIRGRAFSSLERAFEEAKSAAGPEDLILFTGSTRLYRRAREIAL